MAFQKAFSAGELQPGQGKSVTLSGKRIAVFHIGAGYHAIDDLCTHDEASLAEGCVIEQDGTCVVECPWHGAHFDLKTGAALTLPAVTPVKTYAVRINGDALEVDA